MLTGFAILMKCSLTTKCKTLLELLFFKFLLHINTELFALLLVICPYGLHELQFVGFHYQAFPCYLPNCRWRNQGFQTCSSYGLFGALQECLAKSLNLSFQCCWSSRSFCSAQTAFVFKFFCQVQVCFAVGDFLENFLANARCIILFEFVLACSNAQNAFSLPVNTIYTHKFEYSLYCFRVKKGCQTHSVPRAAFTYVKVMRATVS